MDSCDLSEGCECGCDRLEREPNSRAAIGNVQIRARARSRAACTSFCFCFCFSFSYIRRLFLWTAESESRPPLLLLNHSSIYFCRPLYQFLFFDSMMGLR
ncbi:hypothetical protein AAC387_Pa08g0031 [Persea americana]